MPTSWRGLREEGYTVEVAADGIDGLHRLRTEAWDVVLLDWWLPGHDGLTVLRRFREAGGTVPVLFLTARDAVSDRVRGLDGGADDYLCKPFAFEELLARVRSLARRHDRTAGTVLRHGGVSIDLATQRAERGGCRLELTAKEQALLVLFLRIPARCCRARASTSGYGRRATTALPIRWRSTSWNCGASWKPWARA